MNDFEELVERIPLDRFWPLPHPTTGSGEQRRTGVEIEFSGLSEVDAAEVVATVWGGTAKLRAPHELVIEATRLGDVQLELDTALKERSGSPIADPLLDLSRAVVPVEIVTPPLQPSDLPEVDRLLKILKDKGARGSRDGAFLAFGIHLNPEIASEDATGIVPTVRAFAFVEQWLRASDPPDISRRFLPFIDPWPRRLVDRVAADGAKWELQDLRDTYLELVSSRNYGLDLLPLLEHLFPEDVRAALSEGQAKGGRPTWHYRLPETGLGAAKWSFAYEWNRWALVERVAAAPVLLETLSEAWIAHRSAMTTLRPDWAHDVNDILAGADIWDG